MKNSDDIDQADQPTQNSMQGQIARPLVTFDPSRMVITIAPEAVRALADIHCQAQTFVRGLAQVALIAHEAVRPLIERVNQWAPPLLNSAAPSIQRWSQRIHEAAAAAVRLAPAAHEWLIRFQERTPFIFCELTSRSLHEEKDLATVQKFSANVLRIKVAHDELYFVALALATEPWAAARDPIAYIRKVVSLSLRRARRRPEADPRSPQYLPRSPRLGPDATPPSIDSLEQDVPHLLDTVEDVRAHQPLHEALFLHSLTRTGLRLEAQQLLRLRMESVGKKEAAQLLGWSMTKLEKHWKEIDRAERHLRLRLLS